MIEEPRIEPPRDDESDLLAGPAGREDIGLDEIEENEDADEEDDLGVDEDDEDFEEKDEEDDEEEEED